MEGRTASLDNSQEDQTTFEMLPMEVKDIIFQFIPDLRSLITLREVSKTSKDLVDGLLSRDPVKIVSIISHLHPANVMGFIYFYRNNPGFTKLREKHLNARNTMTDDEMLCYALTTDDITLLDPHKLETAIAVILSRDTNADEATKACLQGLRVTAHLLKNGYEKLQTDGLFAPPSFINLARLDLDNGFMNKLDKIDNIAQHLSGANLERVNFSYANLSNAKLQNANFRLANLKGIKLEGADLQGAQFQGVHNFAHILTSAIETGDLSIATLLLENGADLKDLNHTIISNEVADLLIKAASKKAFDFLTLLTKYTSQADVTVALINSAYTDRWDVVKILIENYNADINAHTDTSTLLGVAAYKGNLDMVKWLLDHEAKIDLPTRSGNALFTAAYERHWDIVRLLIERGADVNAGVTSETVTPTKTTIQVTTPIFWIAQYCEWKGEQWDVLKLFLEKGADINTLGPSTLEKLLQKAAVAGAFDVVELLEKKGARDIVENFQAQSRKEIKEHIARSFKKDEKKLKDKSSHQKQTKKGTLFGEHDVDNKKQDKKSPRIDKRDEASQSVEAPTLFSKPRTTKRQKEVKPRKNKPLNPLK